MSAYTASQIETMARVFTAKQSEALSALELSSKIDGELFEAMMDQVADNLKLCEAGWDLFASLARLQFYGFDKSHDVRMQWARVADAARDELFAAEVADLEAQAADFRADARRDAAA